MSTDESKRMEWLRDTEVVDLVAFEAEAGPLALYVQEDDDRWRWTVGAPHGRDTRIGTAADELAAKDAAVRCAWRWLREGITALSDPRLAGISESPVALSKLTF